MDNIENFMAFWDILWPFGTFCVYLVHFSGFGIMCQEKYGNPASPGFPDGLLSNQMSQFGCIL
jgi:hypothetical protein